MENKTKAELPQNVSNLLSDIIFLFSAPFDPVKLNNLRSLKKFIINHDLNTYTIFSNLFSVDYGPRTHTQIFL